MADICANPDCVLGDAEVFCETCRKSYCRGHADHASGHQMPQAFDRPGSGLPPPSN
jgi:hypothetical protein